MKRINQFRSIAILVGITANSICIGQNVNTPTTGGGQVVNNLTKWTNVGDLPSQ